MKYCPSCGSKLPDEAVFCSQCGSQFINQRYENQNSHINSLQNNIGSNQSAQTMASDDSTEGGMKPTTAIISMVVTFILFFVAVEIFELQIDQIMSYVLYFVAGVAILYYIGSSMTWSEKNGKNTLSKTANILGGVLFLLLLISCIMDIYSWITD